MKKTLRRFTKIYKFLSDSKQLILRLGRAVHPYRLRCYQNRMGFHGDPVWRYLVASIKDWFPVTSCVETGSFKGDTALFLAKVFPDIFKYSVELSGEYHRESTWRLRGLEKSLVVKSNSPAGIANLIKESKVGDLPLFFLDAHWYEYWPLPDELKEISKLNKAIIMIDDFEVAGRPEYGFDTYKLGDKDMPNNFDFISPAMSARSYRYLLPKYRAEEAFPEDPKSLRGYTVIFQNIGDAEWEKVTNSELVRNKYSTGILPVR